MTPDTDRYHDGGIIAGELTDRELVAIESQQAADARSACLNECLVTIVQAQEVATEATRYQRGLQAEAVISEIRNAALRLLMILEAGDDLDLAFHKINGGAMWAERVARRMQR